MGKAATRSRKRKRAVRRIQREEWMEDMIGGSFQDSGQQRVQASLTVGTAPLQPAYKSAWDCRCRQRGTQEVNNAVASATTAESLAGALESLSHRRSMEKFLR